MRKRIIDVCCGPKSFWFDKNNKDVEFCDKRYEEDILLCNGQHIQITPDTICDFKNLPFPDNTFYLVVFDPPHLVDKKDSAWMVKKYGTLPKDLLYEVAKQSCIYVSKNVFKTITEVENPQGILAVIEKKDAENSINYDEDVILVLDGIQDPGNLGTIIRTLDSVNLKQIKK